MNISKETTEKPSKLKHKIEPITYSVLQVANLLSVSDVTIYEMIKQKKIPHIMLTEKRVVIPKNEFEKWLKKKTFTAEDATSENDL